MTHTHAHAEHGSADASHGHGHGPVALILFGGRRRRIFARLTTASGAHRGDRVLDVGCGTGSFTRRIAQAVAPDGTTHGIDPSGEAITEARRLTRLDNCTFSTGVAEALDDAPDASYDVVVSSLMIHHLPDELRPQAISEMFRVLRPGGSVLVAEFRPPASHIGRRLIRPFVSPAMANNRVELVDAMVRDAGFEQLRSGRARPWTYYVQALKPA
jgi:ubiquinone/menaquinone biosynthesis C-methylase UbiE